MLGKRADGYHDLDTIFQTVSLHDTIEISRDRSVRKSFCHATIDRYQLDRDNLVIRAARLCRIDSHRTKARAFVWKSEFRSKQGWAVAHQTPP